MCAAEHIATGRSGIENQGKHFWEAPFSPSEWKGNEVCCASTMHMLHGMPGRYLVVWTAMLLCRAAMCIYSQQTLTTLLPSQSGIAALGVSGVAVYFLLDYWLKSKYENRGALAEVRAIHQCHNLFTRGLRWRRLVI